MTDLLYAGGTWLYFECVTFVIHLAAVLGWTYRDANALLFFVLWPAVTLGLAAWVGWNAVALWRAPGSSRKGRRLVARK